MRYTIEVLEMDTKSGGLHDPKPANADVSGRIVAVLDTFYESTTRYLEVLLESEPVDGLS